MKNILLYTDLTDWLLMHTRLYRKYHYQKIISTDKSCKTQIIIIIYNYKLRKVSSYSCRISIRPIVFELPYGLSVSLQMLLKYRSLQAEVSLR